MLRRRANRLRIAASGAERNIVSLPESMRLLDRIQEAVTVEDLQTLSVPDARRTASYCARPDPSLPHLRFHILDADPNLLAFIGQESPGFEVLQFHCSGLQYHWRSDLARVFEEEIPLVSRLYGLSDMRELVLEHLALPIIRRHRVREIRGWFTFSEELGPCGGGAGPNAVSMFRRTEQSQIIHLPMRLLKAGEGAARQGLLRSLKVRWRPKSDVSSGSPRTQS